jgi:serine/threonine protein kinase
MPDRTTDDAFAKHLLKAGILTDAQIQLALKEQADLAQQGEAVALGEVLVRQGRLTAEQRENIGKKLEVQKEEAKRLGPYRVLKKLGEGGMGAVYLAEGAETGEQVALKVLPRVASKDQDAVRRFLREVESARRLEHPYIVRAGAAGEDKGFHFYVMEYVEGETLGARLKREGFLLPREATGLVLQVARGLGYAHGLGFIHRDIKPDNVIVTREGVAKILDMGLSKNIDEAQTFRTVTGVSLGTPHYIAPEQARGDKGVDGRADIYSLGATYYHLVTGETPFHGTTAIELISQHLHKQIPDPRDVRDGIPDGVVHIIRRMMAKEPHDRYRDCGALITDLDLVLGGEHPSSQSLDAARSVVALPMAGDAREQDRAQIRQRPHGARRATTAPRANRFPLMVWGAGAAAALALLLVLVFDGRSKPSATKPQTAATNLSPTPPTERMPNQTLSSTKTPAKRRLEEAQAKLDEIKGLEREGRLDPDEIRHRFAEFAKAYADTPQGASVAARPAAPPPKPPVKLDASANLVAHWTLNENAADTRVADATGRFHAAWTRNTNLDSVEGKIQAALNCNAANYADAGNVIFTPDALLDANGGATKPFSISAWVYRTAIGNEDHIVAKQENTPPYRGIILRFDRNDTLRLDLVHRWPSSCIETKTATIATINAWIHCVVTYDGSANASGVKMYINGISQNLNIAKDTLKNNGVNISGKNFQLGARDGASRFHGKLDDIRIYSFVLSQRQVDAIYNKGAGTE